MIKKYFKIYLDITKSSWKHIGLELIVFVIVISEFLSFLIIKSNTILLSYSIVNIRHISVISILFIISCLSLIYYFAILKNSKKIKFIIIAILLFFYLLTVGILIEKRNQGNISFIPHDGVSQIEVSIDYILDGKNPYHESFKGTAMDNPKDRNIWWLYERNLLLIPNPALENIVYPPLSFLLPIPFQVVSQQLFGFYDNRIFLFLFYFLSIFLIYKLVDKEKLKIPAVLFFAFNPFLMHDMAFGINDIVSVFFLLWSLYLLKTEKFKSSILIITLGTLVKQNLIFYWPFLLFYIFIKKGNKFNIKNILKFSRYGLIILIPLLIILLPFILWSPADYYNDTIYYLSHSYPIKGIGLSNILLNSGFISGPFEYYPFWIWQLSFFVITLPILLRKQYLKNNIFRVYLFGTILMGGVWFLARYFHESHANVIVTNFILALFL